MRFIRKYLKTIIILVISSCLIVFNTILIIHLSLNKQYLVFPLYGEKNNGFDEIDADYGNAILYLILNTFFIIIFILYYILKSICFKRKINSYENIY